MTDIKKSSSKKSTSKSDKIIKAKKTSNLFDNINESDFNLTFTLNNINIPIGMANAIRRIMIAEVNIIAIHPNDINFSENNTSFHNEYISHRLSYIPIINSDLIINSFENISFQCNEFNDSFDLKDITINNFNIFSDNNDINVNNLFVYPNTLITTLKPGEKINFEGKLKMSNSKKDGANFNPTSVSIYTFPLDTDAINKTIANLNKDSDEIFEFQKLGSNRLYLKNDLDEPIAYNFNIESIGSLKPKQIVTLSMQSLIDKLQLIIDSINENNNEIINIFNSKNLMQAYDFKIEHEDDTLGNCITSYLFKRSDVKYCGYFIPHPFDENIVIRIELKENNTMENAIKVFIDNCLYIQNILKDMINKWS